MNFIEWMRNLVGGGNSQPVNRVPDSVRRGGANQLAQSRQENYPAPLERASQASPQLSTEGLVRGGGGGWGPAPMAASSPRQAPNGLTEALLQGGQDALSRDALVAQFEAENLERNAPGNGPLDPLFGPREDVQQPAPSPSNNFFEEMGKGQVRQGDMQANLIRDTLDIDDPTGPPKDTLQNRLLGGSSGETVELTADAYYALNPRQRAAVDFNTALAAAAAEDATETGTADDSYRKRAEALFGAVGAGEAYAPRTLALLEELGIQNTESGALDNYLNLSGAVNERDLELLATADVKNTLNDPRAQNTMLIDAAINDRVYSSLNNGNTLLDELRGVQLGGLSGTATPSLGVQAQQDEGLRQMLEDLIQYTLQPDADETVFANTVADMEVGYGIPASDIAAYLDNRYQSRERDQFYGLLPNEFDIPALRQRFIRQTGA